MLVTPHTSPGEPVDRGTSNTHQHYSASCKAKKLHSHIVIGGKSGSASIIRSVVSRERRIPERAVVGVVDKKTVIQIQVGDSVVVSTGNRIIGVRSVGAEDDRAEATLLDGIVGESLTVTVL